VHGDNALVWFKRTVVITILMVMPVVTKPSDSLPLFGGKSAILFLPKRGRDALAAQHAARQKHPADGSGEGSGADSESDRAD